MAKSACPAETKPVMCYVPKGQYERWIACAAREERSMSSLVRVAVERYIDWQESVLGVEQGGGEDAH